MDKNIQNAVNTLTSSTVANKPEAEFLVRIVAVEYSAIEARMMFHTNKIRKQDINDPKPFVKTGTYELFLLKNRAYREHHLNRAAEMVQSAIDSTFPSPTDHDLSGLGYVNYCRKMIKVINEQLTEGIPVMCWMELSPFDQKLAGFGMKRGIPMKSTFKPLEKDVDDAVHGKD